jgi:hypothetical protein
MLADPWRSKDESSLLLASARRMVGWMRAPLESLAVDFPVLQELVRTRMRLALRPMQECGSASMGVVAYVLALLGFWMVGMLTAIVALESEASWHWVSVSQAGFQFMLGMLLLVHMSEALVDPTDIAALAPHPVTDRTLFASRLVQLLLLAAFPALAFTGGSLLLAVWRQPPLQTLLAFPIVVALGTITTTGLVALLFALALRLAGPARYQRVALWIQIATAACLAGGFQVFAQLVPKQDFLAAVEARSDWMLVLPPLQSAALFDFACGESSRHVLVGAALAWLVPSVALAATLALASRFFVAGLSGAFQPDARALGGWRRNLFSRLGARLNRPHEARAAFDFARALARREPLLLRGVLPQIISMQAMTLALSLGARKTGELGGGLGIALGAAMLFMQLPTLLELARFSKDADARWILLASPVREPSQLLRGGVKALLLTWYATPALAIMALQGLIFGPSDWPRILLAHELAAVVALFLVRSYEIGLPFTRLPRAGEMNVKNLGLVLLLVLAMSLVVGTHAALCLNEWVQAAAIPALGLLLLVQARALDQIELPKRYALES